MLLSLALLPFLLVTSQETAAPSGDALKAAYFNLKAAEESKDIDQIQKFAVETSQLARKIIQAQEPPQADEVEAWKARMAFAKEVEPYADYALYAAGLKARGAKVIEIYETLEKQSPTSKYVSQLYGPVLAAMTQAGQGAKTYDFAVKAFAKDPNNEDVLVVLADGAMTRKQWDRAATYGSKLATVVTTHAKPEGVSAADWEKRKGLLAGRGYWIAGMSYASMNRHAQADKALRAALPYIKGDPQLMGGALFNLGLSNYNLARATQDKVLMKQALSFSEEAYKMGGPYAQPASQNAYAIKQELTRWR